MSDIEPKMFSQRDRWWEPILSPRTIEPKRTLYYRTKFGSLGCNRYNAGVERFAPGWESDGYSFFLIDETTGEIIRTGGDWFKLLVEVTSAKAMAKPTKGTT